MEQQKNILDHIKPSKLSTPDDSFFSEMAGQVIEKQKVAGFGKAKITRLIYITLASAAIFILGLWLFEKPMDDNLNGKSFQPSLAQVDKQEIEKYLIEELIVDPIDTLKIKTKNTYQGGKSLEELFSALSEEEIEGFLEAEELDPEGQEEEEGLLF